MAPEPTSRLFAGGVLGFAFGGFFDGILLHQILQWHHLLSTVNGADARLQVAADGYFHALMYAIAGIGLWMLWRRTRRGAAISGRALLATMLIGFGVWHIVDGALSHWVLGIHRIRMETESPLLWDLLWFGAFGVLPLITGMMLRRCPGAGARPSGGRFAALAAALLVAGSGAWSLKPSGSEFTTVLFAPGTPSTEIWAAVASVDGRLMWSDPSGELTVIQTGPNARPWRLYLQGVILVGGSGLPAGCFGWSRAF